MVSRNTSHLRTDTFLNIVVLSMGWYLFTVVSHNGYLTRGSDGNANSITMNGNHTTFEFCLESLNLLNSMKFI